MDTRLTAVGIALFVLGILLLAFLLNRVYKRIRYQDTGDPKIKPPRGVSVFLIVLSFIIIILAQSFFWLSSQIKYFRRFGEDGYIGSVSVERMRDPVKSLGVRYVSASGDTVGVENIFFLSGDSWRFSGEIIKFRFANELLRLPEKCYKTIQFNGRYLGRPPPKTSGALLHTRILEGGESGAFTLFRDTRLFKWFAEVDSFATDWMTTEGMRDYGLKVGEDGGIEIERIR